MGTQATATPQETLVEMLAIADIVASKTNRKIPDNEVSEMAASIEQNGVLQPIVVRPQGKKFEIVCGEKRWLGVKAIGGEKIPGVVREMSDEEAQAIQLVENLQRSNPSPMEEAQAFGNLRKLRGKGATTESIASEVGKDATYVAQRLKLLDLINDAKTALSSKWISISHALVLAPLDPKQQSEVLKWALHYSEPTGCGHHIQITHSVAAMRSFIERQFMLSLEGARFDVKDEKLVPKMGSCVNCTWNTSNKASLFPDIKGATCTNPDCYFDKVRATIDVKVKDLTEADGRKPYRLALGVSWENQGKSKVPVDGYYYQDDRTRDVTIVEKGKECKATQTAILVFRGRQIAKEIKAQLGDTTLVCADPKCPTHRTQRSDGSTKPKALKGLAFVKHKEGNLAKSQPQRIRWAVYKDLAGRLLAGSKGTVDTLQPLMLIAAENASDHLFYDSARDAAKALGYEKPATPNGYGRTPWESLIEKHFKGNAWAWLLAINAAEHIRSDEPNSALFQIAKAYKVDVSAIVDSLKKADKELVSGMTTRAKQKESRQSLQSEAKEKFNKSLHVIGGKECWYVERKLDKPIGKNSAAPGITEMPEAGPFKSKELAEECMKLIRGGMKAKAATQQVRGETPKPKTPKKSKGSAAKPPAEQR